eukprot:2596087-Lingulodinium_polyedra.AAC.1
MAEQDIVLRDQALHVFADGQVLAAQRVAIADAPSFQGKAGVAGVPEADARVLAPAFYDAGGR